jgi:type IV pilus assembly protein PilY1
LNNINDTPGTFNNHYFFINIPQVDDSTLGYPIKNAILAMLDLTPVQNPRTTWWETKLPLKPNSLTANTSGTPQNQTPIADSLYMAKRYFEDYIKQDPPSTAKCRGNYIILLTDGLESCRYLDPGTNLIPDFDLGATASQDLYNIGVNTFVIGFGKAAGTNLNALNKMARAGSNGMYDAFFTDTLAGLTNAIQTIFQIIGGSYSRSNPVVTSNRNRLYRGYFNLPGYEGHLAAFDLNTDGTIKTPEIWDAGKIMATAAKRGTLYTWIQNVVNPPREVFDPAGFIAKIFSIVALKGLLNPLDEDINGDGKTDGPFDIWSIMDSAAIVNFTNDQGYAGGKYKGVRSGTWILGDIYHSTPLVVGPPVFNFSDSAFPQKYSDFKNTWKSRETVIYVGANDGMLHGIKDSDGTEKFAILPRNLLGKLKDLRTNAHQFYIDSSPRAYDVFFGGAWRTIIVNGERGGGNYYFAVDVTDPADPQILWEMTDPGMGNTWSRPEIGWVRISGVEKFVAFVGGGYSTTDDVGNTFYVIDVQDGSILRKFTIGASTNKVPAGATAFDSDLDGRVNGVYFGDLNGVLWKIKIDGEEDISKWQLINLYTPGTNSPVFYPPAVTKNNQGKILVYYGQGNELILFEQVSSNNFFEIWDKGSSGQLNWQESLGAGEKVLAAPAVANNVVYFTTWKYTGDKTDCGAGKGRIYGLTTTSLGVTGDMGALVLDPLTGKDTGVSKKYIDITVYFPTSKGIPSGPVVTNGMIYISTSLNAGQSINIPIPAWGTGKLKYWREVF